MKDKIFESVFCFSLVIAGLISCLLTIAFLSCLCYGILFIMGQIPGF